MTSTKILILECLLHQSLFLVSIVFILQVALEVLVNVRPVGNISIVELRANQTFQFLIFSFQFLNTEGSFAEDWSWIVFFHIINLILHLVFFSKDLDQL